MRTKIWYNSKLYKIVEPGFYDYELSELFFINIKKSEYFHRKNGPAETYIKNNVKYIYWDYKNKLHRIDGPGECIIYFNDDNIVINNFKGWWFKNNTIKEEEYWNE